MCTIVSAGTRPLCCLTAAGVGSVARLALQARPGGLFLLARGPTRVLVAPGVVMHPHTHQTKQPQVTGQFLIAPTNQKTTLNNGYLGSRNDEERSEMRYVV